ncbi:MAG TPA: hypothetical protein V6D16_21295 [Candidatus Obscuribacterales bacterium]
MGYGFEFVSVYFLSHFFVQDTGIVLPGDRESRLFPASSPTNFLTPRSYVGTGLGLATL